MLASDRGGDYGGGEVNLNRYVFYCRLKPMTLYMGTDGLREVGTAYRKTEHPYMFVGSCRGN